MQVALNARHGPWSEGIRCAGDAVFNHTRLFDMHSCPVFDTFLPKILADRGEAHRFTEPGISEEVWAEWVEGWHWRQRGRAVSDTLLCIGPS
eukprot:3496771-Amphidinium_carterae.1